MNARWTALVLILASWPLWTQSAAAQEKPASRPNIVFIFADDHAYQAIGAYGSKVNQTPNIDRLAREGMRFDRCYVTNSICGPSRAVIQTGKYSHLNGFYRNGNRFNGDQQTFQKLLQKAGYQTAVVGKWHLESDPQGFDYWEILIGQGPYYNPTMIRNGQRVQHTGYTTEIITEQAMDWLANKRDPKKPFMLMFQHKAPHREWEPGPKYFSLYENKIPEPETLFDDYANRASPARNQDMTIEKTMTPRDLKLVTPPSLNAQQKEAWEAYYGPRNEQFKQANLEGKDLVRWKYQRYMHDYLACIAAVDDAVGRVLKHLDDAGLAGNTVVIYSSDQGFYLGEHGWFDKRWMYEESFRTPLLVRWPSVTRPGSVNGDIVSNLDFAETFLDIAGVETPSDMQGRSLRPVLAGKTPADWRKSFYYHYYEFPGPHSVAKHYGVTNGKQKLIHYYELGEWELFDLTKDPHELNSVYGQSSYASTQKELESELARLRRQLQVPEKDPPESFPPMRRPAAQRAAQPNRN
jgi:arylsulfatase A-like enzyme